MVVYSIILMNYYFVLSMNAKCSHHDRHGPVNRITIVPSGSTSVVAWKIQYLRKSGAPKSHGKCILFPLKTECIWMYWAIKSIFRHLTMEKGSPSTHAAFDTAARHGWLCAFWLGGGHGSGMELSRVCDMLRTGVGSSAMMCHDG